MPWDIHQGNQAAAAVSDPRDPKAGGVGAAADGRVGAARASVPPKEITPSFFSLRWLRDKRGRLRDQELFGREAYGKSAVGSIKIAIVLQTTVAGGLILDLRQLILERLCSPQA